MKKYWLTKGLRYTLTLSLFAAISAMTLSVTNQFTAPIIAETEQKRLEETLAQMLPEADEFRLMPIDEDYDVYLGIKEGLMSGVILPAESRGFYGEPVEILILVNTDGEIKNVEIQRHRETPGIGTKIEKPEFLSQFTGEGRHLLEDNDDALEGFLKSNIDTVSGATVSSSAVITGVGQALEEFAATSSSLFE